MVSGFSLKLLRILRKILKGFDRCVAKSALTNCTQRRTDRTSQRESEREREGDGKNVAHWNAYGTTGCAIMIQTLWSERSKRRTHILKRTNALLSGRFFPFVRVFFFFLTNFEIQSLSSSFLIEHPLSLCCQFDLPKKIHWWCTEKCKRTRKFTAQTHSTIKIMVWRRRWQRQQNASIPTWINHSNDKYFEENIKPRRHVT